MSLDASQETGASAYESSAALRVEHGGGSDLDPDELSVVVDGERVAARSNLTVRYSWSPFDVGGSLVVEQTADSGLTGCERVLLLYHPGDEMFRLGSFTVEGGGPGAGPSVFGFEETDVGSTPESP